MDLQSKECAEFLARDGCDFLIKVSAFCEHNPKAEQKILAATIAMYLASTLNAPIKPEHTLQMSAKIWFREFLKHAHQFLRLLKKQTTNKEREKP
jgi:hypothetical protein